MNDQKKILLVEDDLMVVRMYERKLVMDGFDLALARNGEECMHELEKGKPDIILLDIMMPEKDGLETLQAIKADPRFYDLPVVILTNLGDRPEDVEYCKKLGAADYWIKVNMPLHEITDRIKKLIANREK